MVYLNAEILHVTSHLIHNFFIITMVYCDKLMQNWHLYVHYIVTCVCHQTDEDWYIQTICTQFKFAQPKCIHTSLLFAVLILKGKSLTSFLILYKDTQKGAVVKCLVIYSVEDIWFESHSMQLLETLCSPSR